MVALRFNAKEYIASADAPDYSQWALGPTLVRIIAATEGIGSTSGHPHYVVQIEAIDGPNINRKHKIYYLRAHPNQKVVDYATRDLANLCIALGKEGFDHISELCGHLVMINVGTRLNKAGETVGMFNRFSPAPMGPNASATSTPQPPPGTPTPPQQPYVAPPRYPQPPQQTPPPPANQAQANQGQYIWLAHHPNATTINRPPENYGQIQDDAIPF